MTRTAILFLLVFIFIIALLTAVFYATGSIVVFFIASWVPTITAVILLPLIRQGAELRTLLRSFRIDSGLLRVIPLLLLSAALVTAALIVFIKMFGLKKPYSLPQILMNVPMMLFTGALGEELGWRGVFLKQMLKKTNFMISSIAMGLLWAASHLPLWLIPALKPLGYAGNPFLIFTASLTGASFIYTWVFIYSRGNLLACMLLHFIQNYLLSYTINLNTDPSNFYVVYTIINLLIAVVIVANWRKVEKEQQISISNNRLNIGK